MPTRKPRVRKPRFSWTQVSRDQQAKLLDVIGGDGHTIWSADALKADGLDAAMIDAFTTVEKSDGSWKGSIFSSETGELQPELRGVYGLSVIRSLASHYLVTSAAFGRGTEARQLTQGIRERMDEIMREGRS